MVSRVPDGLYFDGSVRDERRIRYLRNHLAHVHRAMDEGVPVKGYFHRSLMDNFEWALGYGQRFGLVFVDFKTQNAQSRIVVHGFPILSKKKASQLMENSACLKSCSS